MGLSLDLLKKYHLEEVLGTFTRKNLALINGKCRDCGNEASVAYFPKGSFRWENDWPQLEKIVAKPKILCKDCAIKKFLPSIRNYKYPFVIPVYQPNDNEGICFPFIR